MTNLLLLCAFFAPSSSPHWLPWATTIQCDSCCAALIHQGWSTSHFFLWSEVLPYFVCLPRLIGFYGQELINVIAAVWAWFIGVKYRSLLPAMKCHTHCLLCPITFSIKPLKLPLLLGTGCKHYKYAASLSLYLYKLSYYTCVYSSSHSPRFQSCLNLIPYIPVRASID